MEIVNGPIRIFNPAVAATSKSRYYRALLSFPVDRRVRSRNKTRYTFFFFSPFCTKKYEIVVGRRVNHEFDEGNAQSRAVYRAIHPKFPDVSDLFGERSNVEGIHRASFRNDVDA